jgi:hypothetical protein
MVFNANFQQYFSYIVAVSFMGGKIPYVNLNVEERGRRGRDRMAVGFTTTYVTSNYQH